MPFAPQQIPWYIVWAQYFQIATAFLLPIFFVVVTTIAAVSLAKLNSIAKSLRPVPAGASEAAPSGESERTEEDSEPDISEFVE